MTIREALTRKDLTRLVYVVWGVHEGQNKIVKIGMAERSTSSLAARMRKHVTEGRRTPSPFGRILNENDPAYLDWTIDVYTVEECAALTGDSFTEPHVAEKALVGHFGRPPGNAW
jgi:hypothetical protein